MEKRGDGVLTCSLDLLKVVAVHISVIAPKGRVDDVVRQAKGVNQGIGIRTHLLAEDRDLGANEGELGRSVVARLQGIGSHSLDEVVDGVQDGELGEDRLELRICVLSRLNEPVQEEAVALGLGGSQHTDG